MAVLGISHVAVGVSDMERSLVFYRDIVGLRVTLDTIEGAFVGDPAAYRRRAVYLRAEDGPHSFFIVLDQQLDREPFGSPPRILQLGTHHFSFWVDNLRGDLRAAGRRELPGRLRPHRRRCRRLRRGGRLGPGADRDRQGPRRQPGAARPTAVTSSLCPASGHCSVVRSSPVATRPRTSATAASRSGRWRSNAPCGVRNRNVTRTTGSPVAAATASAYDAPWSR